MTEILLFALLGLGFGSLVAGLGLGIVLSYRGSGTVNLAMGAVAMLGAYVFYDLRTAGVLLLPPLPLAPHTLGLGAPWATVPAFAAAMAACALTGALYDVAVVRRLRAASALTKLLGSLGLLVTLQAIATLRFGTSGQVASAVIPAGPDEVVRVFGQAVPLDRFVLVGIVVLAAALLGALYRFSGFGLATRAAAEDETKAMLAGLPANRLSLGNTMLAFGVAGALGVLVAPMTQLDPTTLPLAVVPALAAALFARFTSLATVTAAGLAMGTIGSLVTYCSAKPWFPSAAGVPIPGVAELLFFVIVVIALRARGTKLPERGAPIEAHLPAAPRADRLRRRTTILTAIAVLALAVLPFDFRQALINSLIASVVCLSFVVTTGFAGQPSILQVGLAGAAGFVVSKLGVQAGIGFPVAPVLAAAAATALGSLVAVSALRVRGVNLAIVTLAGGLALQQFVFANPSFGGGAAGTPVAPLHLLGLDLSPNAAFPVNGANPPSPVFGFVCVAAVVALGLLVASIRRSSLGQRMLAVRSNERAAAAAGIEVRAVKLTAFAISSAIAGIAGALYAYDFGSVTAQRFGVTVALAFIAYAYLGGITTVSGALVGGLLASEGLVPHAVNVWFGVPVDYQMLVAGVALVVTIMFNPMGIAGAFRAARREAGWTTPAIPPAPAWPAPQVDGRLAARGGVR